ncbi:NADH dehydrogenase [ubiquinone] 1 alpha subcomplex assembly factor 2 isoform X2 [Nomia melanderi]|uniref:NADH dehydrogenase [ubiquinone] 1 alpha subcomplex assembly factor 2 isoform X2 n=1 Tax=Nomia melanderi TaxID=2448451 RepID=UPI003FCC700F
MCNCYIGEDYYGTKYYESTSARRKNARYFIPVNKEDFEQEIPVEWESWLRYRRRDPPTEEEIKKNYDIAMMKKEKAAEIAVKFGTDKTPEALPAGKGQESFPKYEEYTEKPK